MQIPTIIINEIIQTKIVQIKVHVEENRFKHDGDFKNPRMKKNRGSGRVDAIDPKMRF